METISNDYTNLFNKYQFDKLAKNTKIDNVEIDSLINNISNFGNYIPNTKSKSPTISTPKIYLSQKLLTFFNSNSQYFRSRPYGDEMNPRDLEYMLKYIYSYHNMKNTDNEIYDNIKIISSCSRYEKKKYINEFITKFTTKTKEIKIGI